MESRFSSRRMDRIKELQAQPVADHEKAARLFSYGYNSALEDEYAFREGVDKMLDAWEAYQKLPSIANLTSMVDLRNQVRTNIQVNRGVVVREVSNQLNFFDKEVKDGK